MTITINDMVAFSRFMGAHKDDKMSLKTAFKFNKLAKEMQSDMEFFQQKYKEIVNAYAEITDDGNSTFRVKEENVETYLSAMDELGKVEITVPDIHFTVEELNFISITIEDLTPIMAFIEE